MNLLTFMDSEPAPHLFWKGPEKLSLPEEGSYNDQGELVNKKDNEYPQGPENKRMQGFFWNSYGIKQGLGYKNSKGTVYRENHQYNE